MKLNSFMNNSDPREEGSKLKGPCYFHWQFLVLHIRIRIYRITDEFQYPTLETKLEIVARSYV